MKVLLVNYRYFVSGGPERYMFGATKLLEEAGHSVVPFSIRYARNVSSPWSDYFVNPISGEDAVYFSDHDRTPRTLLKSLERTFYSREVYSSLSRLVRAEKPDVALVLHYLRKLSPSVLTALRDNGVPIVVRLSDFGMVCAEQHLVRDGRICELCVGRSMWPSLRYRCVKGSLAASAANAAAMYLARRLAFFDAIDTFVTPSSIMRDRMVKGGWSPERLVHIPTFVAAPAMVSPSDRRRGVTYVGRLEPTKGVDVLLDAVAVLSDRPGLEDVPVTIVGDDTTAEARRIKRRAQSLGLRSVVFKGRCTEEEVVRILSGSLLSVVPSIWHENLPNAMLESLACGAPVVGSDVSSVAEVLSDGLAGVVFEAGNAAALARALESLLGDPERLATMSVAARQLAITKYAPSRHLALLLGVLRDATSSKPSPTG